MREFDIRMPVDAVRSALEEEGTVDETIIDHHAQRRYYDKSSSTTSGYVPFNEEYLTKEEYRDRLDTCDACEFLQGSICIKFKRSCGCGGDLHASRRRGLKCPEGKW